MAGFSKIYCIGGLGGFQGADSIKAHYIDRQLHPLGMVTTLIPERPNLSSALIDACLAFYPEHFRTCPTLAVVEKLLADVSHLDFDANKDDIPKEWLTLRQEAKPLYRTLNIFEADLHHLDVAGRLL